MNTKDKVPFYVNQCHEMGIEVLPPDVNTSDVGFTVVEGKIRFGMNAVKGVGVGAIEAIIAAREDGRAVRVGLRLLRPRRLADGQQARARGAHPQRRVRQHRRMPALAITDHGVLSGIIQFYRSAKKQGIKPIIGLEAYVVEDRFRKEGATRSAGTSPCWPATRPATRTC